MAKHRGSKATVAQLAAMNIVGAEISAIYANCIVFANKPNVYLTVGDSGASFADDNEGATVVRKILRGSAASIASQVDALLKG